MEQRKDFVQRQRLDARSAGAGGGFGHEQRVDDRLLRRLDRRQEQRRQVVVVEKASIVQRLARAVRDAQERIGAATRVSTFATRQPGGR